MNAFKLDSILIQVYVLPLKKFMEEEIENFIKLVEATLDMDQIVEKNIFVVNADFDDHLGELASKKQTLEEEMKQNINAAARSLNIEGDKLKLELTHQHGYTYRITMDSEKKCREKLKKSMYIIDTSKSGVRFRDQKMDRLNREYLSVRSFIKSALIFIYVLN